MYDLESHLSWWIDTIIVSYAFDIDPSLRL